LSEQRAWASKAEAQKRSKARTGDPGSASGSPVSAFLGCDNDIELGAGDNIVGN